MFHYTTHVSLTLGDDELWRDKVPVLAFENPYLLRLLLAIAAIHLSRYSSTHMARYERLGENHFTLALREVTSLLPTLNSQNCSALYVATVLICNYTFAQRRTGDNLFVVANYNQVAWWKVFRGVRFVIERTSLEEIFANGLGPFPRQARNKWPELRAQTGYIPWETHLANIKTLTHVCEESEEDLLEVLRQGLVDCFREVYGTLEKPLSSTNGKMHVVLRWLWILNDGFADQIERKTPVALILLAHYAVILQTLECYWFMEGWAVHIMQGIAGRLEPGYQDWISWPQVQIGC